MRASVEVWTGAAFRRFRACCGLSMGDSEWWISWFGVGLFLRIGRASLTNISMSVFRSPGHAAYRAPIRAGRVSIAAMVREWATAVLA